MADYPRSVGEFETRFATEDACRVYLSRLRWPDGFRCRCGEAKAWWTGRGLWQCAACGAQTSVTAGKGVQEKRKTLPVWFFAVWGGAGPKKGGRGLAVQRVFGVGGLETAGSQLHTTRRGVGRAG